MVDKIIYSNEFIEIAEKDDDYYIRGIERGYNINDFNHILNLHPRIKLTNFSVLKNVITDGKTTFIKFGIKKPKIEVQISKDHLKASIYLNITNEELMSLDKKNLVQEILSTLTSAGVVYGVKFEDMIKNLKPQTKIEVAEGMEPTTGDDCIIKMYEVEEVKPKIEKDGTVNHYELNLINTVNKGDWLGERIDAKEGAPGKTVLSEEIPAQRGRQHPLRFDKRTVEELYDEENGITTLYAKKSGAVVYHEDVIAINDYLEIEGNVSFETGNIDFDGSVNVTETVEDNFSVTATNDIEIRGDLGIGGVDKIESKEGCIYIRGGIAGKKRANIYCNKDLYTKFVSECNIECEGSVYIGYYAINANIKAKEVILQSYDSRIIGGTINAEIRVISGEIGSRSEVLTQINVKGFNKAKLKKEYDDIIFYIDKINDKLVEYQQKISIYKNTHNLDKEQMKQLRILMDNFDALKKKLGNLYEQRKKYTSYLTTKGEGEITVNKTIYPKSKLTIKENTIHISETVNKNISYYVAKRHVIAE